MSRSFICSGSTVYNNMIMLLFTLLLLLPQLQSKGGSIDWQVVKCSFLQLLSTVSSSIVFGMQVMSNIGPTNWLESLTLIKIRTTHTVLFNE